MTTQLRGTPRAGERVGAAVRALREHPSLSWITPEVVTYVRWAAMLAWLFCFSFQVFDAGIPFDREGLLLWVVSGVAAASLGRRALWKIAVDFVPFALVLIAYDYLRGLSDGLGMPTWWHPQVEVDRFLFFGHEPTVWLQEHLKYPQPQWWDTVVWLCYTSFFLLPYVTAGVLWIRARADFYRWSLRFVSLSFLAFILFALIPAAPPWAASRCAAWQVAHHPVDPPCMHYRPGRVRTGGILGEMNQSQDGAHEWVERISARGARTLNLHAAETLLQKGQGTVDLVAAVPSLHLGGTVLFVIFMWHRVHRAWRPFFVAYPLLMTFSLVYSAEHYVADCIAGALCAVLICVLADRVERWWRARREQRAAAAGTADDLEADADAGALAAATTVAMDVPTPGDGAAPAKDGDSAPHPGARRPIG